MSTWTRRTDRQIELLDKYRDVQCLQLFKKRKSDKCKHVCKRCIEELLAHHCIIIKHNFAVIVKIVPIPNNHAGKSLEMYIFIPISLLIDYLV